MIRLTLSMLIAVLIAVISLTYYANKEGFEDITQAVASTNATPTMANITSSDMTSTDMTNAINTIIPQGTNIPLSTPTISPMPQVTVSDTGIKAMTLQQKNDLLRDIQKVVKNEIIATRCTTPIGTFDKKKAESDAVAQGKEYEKNTHKVSDSCENDDDDNCSKPDMSQYIKKDAIPCWGCKLDY